MTDSTAVAGTVPPRLGLLSRFFGVLLSPRDTFAGVAKDPRWFGMLALVLMISAVCVAGFLMTPVGQQAWLDQAVRSSESFGGRVSDQQYQAMEGMAPYIGYITIAYLLIAAPLITLAMSGILFGIFSAILGGEARFKQVFAIVVHAGAVTALQQLFVMPLNYVRESMTSATNLSVLLPMLPEGAFVTRLLGAIDLFLLWWLVVLAMGLAVLFRRKTGPIAVSFLAIYFIIALIIAAVMSGTGGS